MAHVFVLPELPLLPLCGEALMEVLKFENPFPTPPVPLLPLGPPLTLLLVFTWQRYDETFAQ